MIAEVSRGIDVFFNDYSDTGLKAVMQQENVSITIVFPLCLQHPRSKVEHSMIGATESKTMTLAVRHSPQQPGAW